MSLEVVIESDVEIKRAEIETELFFKAVILSNVVRSLIFFLHVTMLSAGYGLHIFHIKTTNFNIVSV